MCKQIETFGKVFSQWSIRFSKIFFYTLPKFEQKLKYKEKSFFSLDLREKFILIYVFLTLCTNAILKDNFLVGLKTITKITSSEFPYKKYLQSIFKH